MTGESINEKALVSRPKNRTREPLRGNNNLLEA
jgi:hypothetical protein